MKDVIIIGGGASGLVCAIEAARNGFNVIILEKNSNCGKKILVSGNGRCNYWNSDFDITKFNSNDLDILEDIIKDKDMVLPFFDNLGIIPKIKSGYYYPYSNQSISILNSLLSEIKNLNVKVYTETNVLKIERKNNKYIVTTDSSTYSSDYLVISTGSNASVKDETNGYDLASSLGHSIIKPLPALVQLRGNEPYFKDWTGIRCECSISLYENDIIKKKETGELQLTSYGISGICAMQLSSIVARGILDNKKYYVKINFLNFLSSKDEFITWIKNQNSKTNNKSISDILDCVLNYKITNIILKLSHIDRTKKINELKEYELETLVENVITFKLNITGTNSLKEAQVSSGGIPLKEVNKNTLESLIMKNLYFTGEILDVDGNCGGYNLGFAWISGLMVGRSIGRII